MSGGESQVERRRREKRGAEGAEVERRKRENRGAVDVEGGGVWGGGLPPPQSIRGSGGAS
jgi:hypothetical protein